MHACMHALVTCGHGRAACSRVKPLSCVEEESIAERGVRAGGEKEGVGCTTWVEGGRGGGERRRGPNAPTFTVANVKHGPNLVEAVIAGLLS